MTKPPPIDPRTRLGLLRRARRVTEGEEGPAQRRTMPRSRVGEAYQAPEWGSLDIPPERWQANPDRYTERPAPRTRDPISADDEDYFRSIIFPEPEGRRL